MAIWQKIKMYYDPRGKVIRTVNPDNSEQWVIHGKPATLSSVAMNNSWSFKNYMHTPWESYTYDANDLGEKTHPGLGAINTHWNTPSNSIVDGLGRTIKTTSRLDNNTQNNEVVMKYEYDIQGNLLTTTDSLNRIVFHHKYGLAKQLLWEKHIDSGESTAIADATGKPVEATDAKGARVFTGYDVISRPEKNWAKDNSAENITLRQVSVYAETLGLTTATNLNLLGKIYQHYDEAGLNQIESCDFKGNPLEKFKQVISDDELLNAGTNAYTVDWTGLNTAILDATEYRTTVEYDALNRGIKLTLPADINNDRTEIEPVFNKAGALEKVKKDGTEYVKHIAYNAKGQQLLAAWNNDVMMRFAYDKKTFRLKRVKAEKYTASTLPLSGGGGGGLHTYAYNSGTTRYDQQYVYDLVGNILAVNDATPDCGIQNSPNTLQRLFEYDALYRLIYANGREMNTQGQGFLFANAPEIGNPTANDCRYYEQEYEYDKTGNIQKLKHRVIGNTSLYYTRNFVYNSNNNQHTEVNNGQSSPTVYGTFTYDTVGNMLTTNADRNYYWDAANRMKAFKLMSGSTVNTFAHYLYESSGNRTKKLVIKDNGDYESVIYIDGVFEYHKKVTTSTTEQKNHLSMQGGIEIRVGSYSDDGTEATLYTISDYLNSAFIRLKDNGALYDKEEYYPYGDSSLKTYGKKRYRFTGKEKDNESGLYYMNARYYISWCCKFTSVDPLAGKYAYQSSYCYADCNPIVFNDPTGTQTETTGIPNEKQQAKETTGASTEQNPQDNSSQSTQENSQPQNIGNPAIRIIKEQDLANYSEFRKGDYLQKKDGLHPYDEKNKNFLTPAVKPSSVTEAQANQKTSEDKNSEGVQGVAIGTGEVAYRTGDLRLEYQKAAQGLDATNTNARTELKSEFRAKQTGIGKATSETLRPIKNELPKPGTQSAQKTNTGWNNAGEMSKNVGKVLLIGGALYSGYKVITSENKGEAFMKEGVIWSSSIAGAELGGQIGYVVGLFIPIPGASIACSFVGTLVGGYYGGKGGEWLGSNLNHDPVKSTLQRSNNVFSPQYNTMPIDNTRVNTITRFR